MSLVDLLMNHGTRWIKDEDLIEVSTELGKEAAQQLAEQWISSQRSSTTKAPARSSVGKQPVNLNQSYQPLQRRNWFAVALVSLMEAQLLVEPVVEPLLMAA
jgi:hypothetical protein